MADRNAPPAVRVVLVSSGTPMGEALRLVLRGEDGLELVAEADSVDAAVREARCHPGAVLVLDLVLARGLVAESIRRLRRAAPSSGIVALSMDDGPAFARVALAGGAGAYVLADRADGDLADAVRRVAGAARAHASAA